MAEIELGIDRWPDGLAAINGALAGLVDEGRISAEIADHCNLALEELVANVFEHGQGQADAVMVQLRIDCDSRQLTAELVDAGPPFNPLEQPEPDLEADLDDRPIGGLGLFLTRELMDRLDYRRIEGHNHVYLTKHLEPAAPPVEDE